MSASSSVGTMSSVLASSLERRAALDPRPGQDQRDAQRRVEQVLAVVEEVVVLAEALAVVGGEQHERPVADGRALERVEHVAHLGVDGGDLAVVLGHVVAEACARPSPTGAALRRGSPAPAASTGPLREARVEERRVEGRAAARRARAGSRSAARAGTRVAGSAAARNAAASCVIARARSVSLASAFSSQVSR